MFGSPATKYAIRDFILLFLLDKFVLSLNLSFEIDVKISSNEREGK